MKYRIVMLQIKSRIECNKCCRLLNSYEPFYHVDTTEFFTLINGNYPITLCRDCGCSDEYALKLGKILISLKML